MRLNIRSDFAGVQRKLDQLQRDLADKVTVRALNRTIEQAKTQASREIRSEFAVSAGYVRDRLRIKRAAYRSGALELSAELAGTGKPSANVIAFGARQGLRGVSVKIKKTGPRKTIKGAFIANKGRTVFRREGEKRLPIKAISTVDVPAMFSARRINAAVVSAVRGKFPAIFERELQFALSKFNTRK